MISHSKPFLIDKDYLAIQKVLQSGMIAEGEVVAEFENAVAEYLGIVSGVATSSGTMALFLASGVGCFSCKEGGIKYANNIAANSASTIYKNLMS